MKINAKIKSFVFWLIVIFAIACFLIKFWRVVAVWSDRFSFLIFSLVIFVAVFYLIKFFLIKRGRKIWAVVVSLGREIKQSVVKNKEIQIFIKKHPRLIDYLQKRTDRKKFKGLTLTTIFLSCLCLILSLINLIYIIQNNGFWVQADERIVKLTQLFLQVHLIKFFTLITMLCYWPIIVGFIVAVSIILLIWKKKKFILPFWLALGGVGLTSLLGKFVFARSRPIDFSVYLEKFASFPSSHASVSVVFFGFLAYMVIRLSRKLKVRVNAFFLAALLIFAVGFSRIYLSVHYISDVYGGYLLGVLWLIIGIGFAEWRNFTESKTLKLELNSNQKLLTTALIFLALVFWLCFSLNFPPQRQISDSTVSASITTDNIWAEFSDGGLSKYSETLIGDPQSPISFIIVARDDEALKKVFQTAGWLIADEINLININKLSWQAFFNHSYQTAPMTPAFWSGRVNEFNFQKPTEKNSARERHHARFWQTNLKTSAGESIYVGTASLDVGVKWLITDKVNPNIDAEREYLFTDLQATQALRGYQKQKTQEAYLGRNFSGDQFFTDGQAYLIYLK